MAETKVRISRPLHSTDLESAMHIAERIRDKKGEETLVIDVSKVGTIADFLIITSVESSPQLRAIAEDLKLYARKKLSWNVHVAGAWDSEWVVVDMGGIIVHVLDKHLRDYYKLEELWLHGGTTAYYL